MKQDNLQRLSREDVVCELKSLVTTERKITGEILTYIKEIERRRIYQDYNCTSTFAFLTRKIGYTKAAAQRRIDSARLLAEVPEMLNDVQTGALNLSQISLVAQYLRQKKKEDPQVKIAVPDKENLLALVKNRDFEQSQQILAQALDLQVIQMEKKRVQKDESLRLELTFSKSQTEVLNRAKELMSHAHPNPSMAELVVLLAQDFVKRKDPMVARGKVKRSDRLTRSDRSKQISSESELIVKSVGTDVGRKTRPSVPAETRRRVFQRDKCCRWIDAKSGERCGSRFQLEVDHVRSVWAGGRSETDNLQLLCRKHNSMKYDQEVRQWMVQGES